MTRVRVRDATEADVAAVAGIGGPGMLAQYEGLVDPQAVSAAVAQLYARDALIECVARCHAAPDGLFLVAERDGGVAGFMHFDAFGPEPELHRLYCAPSARGLGVGSLLMAELHERIDPAIAYMLLVADGNDRAVAFYERHGLHVEKVVDGLRYYGERMGVHFPSGTSPFRLILMRGSPREPAGGLQLQDRRS